MASDYHDRTEYLNEVERNALGMCLDHLIYIGEGVTYLSYLIERWLNNEEINPDAVIKKLAELERKADNAKHVLLKHLSETPSLLQREDLMRIVLIADKIAENVESAGFHLTTILDWHPPEKISNEILKMVDKVIEVINTLKDAVRVLSINTEKVAAYVSKINSLERSIDFVHRRILDIVASEEIDLRVLLRVRDFINHVEEISDVSEEVADAILILAMSR
ncbi:MAG: hypothetical protein DRO67_08940 [Candidatus Asgardarchaeum californiense]|nr:MAG: hypothetical protein DRO67_08940 [Candidatus Asgardarchaeum californiense]